MPDVALCLYGQMRTYDDCLPFFQENIIDPLDPDVFIHTWEHRGGISNRSSQHTDSPPRQQKIKEDEIKQIYSAQQVVVEKFHESDYDELDGVSPPEEIKNNDQYTKSVLPLLYKLYKCNKLKQKYEKKRDQKYDIVIVTRPDVAIFTPLPNEILNEPDYMWELRSQRSRDTEALDDIIVISSSSNIDSYAATFSQAENYWETALSEKNRNYPVAAQQLLYHHIVKNNICINQPNMRRGTDWEIIRYGMDLSIYKKSSIRQYLYILRHGDSGIYKQKNTIHRGLIILRENGLIEFIREFYRYMIRNIQ